MPIDTKTISEKYRSRCIDLSGRRLLVTDFRNTQQEKDLTDPPNCGGIGRIRHFRRETSTGWPKNGLPIDPACKALGLAYPDMIRAQAFQSAGCNWRCWYCFVPYALLNADPKHSAWLTATDLIERYLAQDDRPHVIDLTGGEPSLIPEWAAWMIAEFQSRDLSRQVYIWSDDNLSNDYFWTKLSDIERESICTYANYGKVCCFKGIDDQSFAFNTSAPASEFALQFHRMKKLLTTGIDLYAYVTLTTPSDRQIPALVHNFVDKLQEVHVNLPLRTIPLEVRLFSPVNERLNDSRKSAIRNQDLAIAAWNSEITHRFSDKQRNMRICDVPIR